MTLITAKIKQIAYHKALNMPLGTYSRLKIDGEISDIIIEPSSSGIWFRHSPNIGKGDIIEFIGFANYKL